MKRRDSTSAVIGVFFIAFLCAYLITLSSVSKSPSLTGSTATTVEGYYSYLYAKCFVATIWQDLCLEDPLSLTTGSALRTKFLQYGGAKDPAELLKDLVGDRVLKYHKGGVIPDVTSLCKEMNLQEDL